MAEQVDRYTRGLKPYIWKEMRIKYSTELAEAMRDAERIEAAHRSVCPRTASQFLKPEYLRRKPMNSSY